MKTMEALVLDSLSRSERTPWAWTDRNNKRAADVMTVMEELKRYWPLTVRQVYYRLISSNVIKEDRRQNPMKSIRRFENHMSRKAPTIPTKPQGEETFVCIVGEILGV